MDSQDSTSIIESPREAEIREAEERAKREAALESEANRKVRTAETRKKILRICLYVLGGLLAVALVAGLVWLVITVVMSVRTPVGEVGGGGDKPADNLPVIGGYQCTTDTCYKVTDLPDGRVLMRDTGYYIFNAETGVAVRTTISEKTYHAIIPFVWGSETLAVLDPETGRSALYSITRNQQVGEFNYDDFIIDAKATEYKGMEWIIGKYIIAKQDTSVRLLDVFDGSEVVRAQNRVFAYSPYFFGYDADGVRRVYLGDGSRVVSAAKGDFLFVKDRRLIHIGASRLTTMDIYTEDGVKVSTSDAYFQSLNKLLSGKRDYPAAISVMSGVYKVSD